MKEFFRTIVATLAGILLAAFICAIICTGIITSLLTSSSSETIIKDNSVFVLNIEGSLMERYTPNPIDQLLGETLAIYGLDDILQSIQKAKHEQRIKGIYLNFKSFNYPPASLKAIHDALEDFKASGKFIIAYGGNYTQGGYYLASVADKIIVNPSGHIMWHGLSTQTLFFTELLQKAGINMQIFRVGKYKSAVEPFMQTQMSEANHRQTEAYIQSIWNNLLTDVSTSRNLPAEKLDSLADMHQDFQTASSYIEAGLADTLMYQDEVLFYLKQLTGCKHSDKLSTLSLNDMIHAKAIHNSHSSSNPIAVYYAYGEIDNGTGYYGEGINSEKMTKDLRKLREDKQIKAVVLRINSPGGSAYGSEQIWREVSLLKAEKPVVVSMGDYAASGGYYIACPAHKIIASPTTLTGSIGIFGMFPDASELLTGKLGLHWDGVKTNRLADLGSLHRPLNEEEKELIQQTVNEGYQLFTQRCAEGRQIPLSELEEIAGGRVWTGAMAKELNLVDELGGLDTAISQAAQLAGLKDYHTVSYPTKADALSLLLDEPVHHYIYQQFKQYAESPYSDLFSTVKSIQHSDRFQARLPFNLYIH